MDDLSSHHEGIELDDNNEPRSYTRDYVLLDRSASDDPVWVLCRYTAKRPARLDENGNPTAADQLDMLEWTTQQLMKVLNPQRVPGGGFTYRLEDGDENPVHRGSSGQQG